MSMSTENPPAFPYAFHFPKADGEPQGINLGMTLRDYFAAKALPALVERASIEEWIRGGPEWIDAVAMEAYKFSDAMLKARGTP